MSEVNKIEQNLSIKKIDSGTVNIQINNNERFTRTDATFFRTMQPYKYHSNTPGGISKAKKKQFIYVYSFALHPEDYQPSGSYNFSIGDDTVSFSFTGPTPDGVPVKIISPIFKVKN